ncbi:MAG: hypothetical protein WCJ30_17105 [Deltaproteobacteria bacterium]
MRASDAAPFIAAALAGLAAHPAEGMRAAEDIAARAVALGFAVAKHLDESEDIADGDDFDPTSDRHPDNRRAGMSASTSELQARALQDLTERVGALETELGSSVSSPVK